MKRWTIRRQLSAFIAGICIISVVGQVIFTQLSFRRGFASYVEEVNSPRLEQIAERLASYYDETLGWELVASDRRIWGDIAINQRGPDSWRQSGGMGPRGQPSDSIGSRPDLSIPPIEDLTESVSLSEDVSRGVLPPGVLPEGLNPGPPPPDRQSVLDAARGPDLTLIDATRNFIVGNHQVFEDGETLDIPISYEGEIVGYLVSPGGMRIASEVDDAFSQKLLQQSAWIGMASAVMAVLAAVFIAKQFSLPVIRLNQGADQLMRGNYEHEIETDGPLEFGLLEQKFNRLAQTLAANRTSQQHWIANISHELRTPLAILQAELDAINSGIRSFGEQEVNSLIEESKRLGRLIDDLFLLSRADSGDLSYQFLRINLTDLIREFADEISERVRQANLKLEVLVPKKDVILIGDADRLRQLLANLVNNSCAYTDAGGLIRLRLVSNVDETYVEVEDSAPGVSNHEREKIFDRLYRAEKSRNRSKGGSGLGLAICSAIADAHGARIEALNSDMGGLRMKVSFKF